MSIPLDELINHPGNAYELACVAINVSNILAANGDQEFENRNEKVVSKSLEMVLLEDIEYSIENAE